MTTLVPLTLYTVNTLTYLFDLSMERTLESNHEIGILVLVLTPVIAVQVGVSVYLLIKCQNVEVKNTEMNDLKSLHL